MKKPLVPMLRLVVPWLCLASAALLLAPGTADAQVLRDFRYLQAKFSIASATPETYNTFIDSVRAALLSTTGGKKSNGIPVLTKDEDPVVQQTFLNITLVNKAGQSISLKMDVVGARFTGYDAGEYQCLIDSATCWKEPFLSSSGATPPAVESSGRDSLVPAGGLGAAATAWRAKDLDDAISSLFLFATGKAANEDLKRGVAACDVIVASAAKFPYIQRRVSAGMWADGNCAAGADGSLGSLQERWPALSSAVQLSYQGAFPAEVQIQRSNGQALRVDNVRRAVPIVSFLQHDKCNKALQAEPAAAAYSSQQIPMVIRSVVQEAAAGGGAPAPAACGQAEPTMHIVGPGGKCLDVRDHKYVSRTQVIIWPCKSTGINENQLWTMKRDGTIRCNGWCLAASSTNVGGATVVIDDCASVPKSRSVWEVRADGTIALGSSSYLVLAATSTADYTGVTVEFDDGGTAQSWTPTNDTAPMVAAIRGYRDLCLQVDGAGAVALSAACGGAAAQWGLYHDGSVRPSAATARCLAPDAAGRLVTSACNLDGSSNQRWVFRNDGTVYNTGAEQVMAARPRLADPGCAVSAWEVAVSPAAAGSPTQSWSIML